MTAAEEEAVEHAVDETTALLAGPGKPVPGDIEDSENGTTKNDNEEDKPLPKDQIFFLCFARLIEPIAFFCIFPFINQMIWETGEVAETDVGFYSGLIVSHTIPYPQPLAYSMIDTFRNPSSH